MNPHTGRITTHSHINSDPFWTIKGKKAHIRNTLQHQIHFTYSIQTSLEGWAMGDREAWWYRLVVTSLALWILPEKHAGFRGHPSPCEDSKTNKLTLSGEDLSYTYRIIIELSGLDVPSDMSHCQQFHSSPGSQDQATSDPGWETSRSVRGIARRSSKLKAGFLDRAFTLLNPDELSFTLNFPITDSKPFSSVSECASMWCIFILSADSDASFEL